MKKNYCLSDTPVSRCNKSFDDVLDDYFKKRFPPCKWVDTLVLPHFCTYKGLVVSCSKGDYILNLQHMALA